VLVSVVIIFIAVLARNMSGRGGSAQITSTGLVYNSQLKAVMSFLFSDSDRLAKTDSANAKRIIPAYDQIQIATSSKHQRINHNVVIVFLEGIQYRYTSLGDKQGNPTPYLARLAEEGVEFSNTRTSLTHTTKALFSLLTGRFASASQDIVEAVPAVKPYSSIVTILKNQLNFRTAFFQSAKGNFESRAGLVYNLGFDEFWTRDDLNDPNAFVGYLGCDEFSMLKPIVEWIKADERPFFVTVLCSVTHDPYEVPKWFEAPAKEALERYQQAITYTDNFLAALDVELTKLNLTDKTIVCVIGDHGEAFGEHGLHGHERIGFEEALRIPFCLRAPQLIEQGTKITEPVSSVDLAPMLLALLGFDTDSAGFDGLNALADIPKNRKVFFSGWLQQSPSGFVTGERKFIYNPTNKSVSAYDLSSDPFELIRIELPKAEEQSVADDIIAWRKNSIFRLEQAHVGKKMLFNTWLCRWNNRVASAKYRAMQK